MRSLTSSSSCNSATDIPFPWSDRGARRGARPLQTDVRKHNASVFVVKRYTARFALTCQSTNFSLPRNGSKGTSPHAGVLYPGPWRLDWPAMEDRGDDVLGNL